MKLFPYLFASTALVYSAGANAQPTQEGFVIPPDVVAAHPTGQYEPVAVTYQDGTDQNEYGDGAGDGATASNARGGTMPVVSYQIDNIPSADLDWIGTHDGSAHKTLAEGAVEAKARFHVNISHISKDDPIRNYAGPGDAHWHLFFGSKSTNAFSTYNSLRNRAEQASASVQVATTAGGGPFNATGYWAPLFIKSDPFADGNDYGVLFDYTVIYYSANIGDASQLSRLVRGERYITGVNMDDPDDLGPKAEIAAANAQAGTSGRYTYKGNGFNGYTCYNSSEVSQGTYKYLKNSDGSDPWGGTCTSGRMSVTLSAPDCYDGTNLWSPGGYKHMRHSINDNQSTKYFGGNPGACPDGWYRQPTLVLTFWYTHDGFSDYGEWRLSSDDMMEAKLTELGTPRAIRNGESFHTDWFGAWDERAFYGDPANPTATPGWQIGCTGVDGGSTPGECNDGAISPTHILSNTANAPDSTRLPQVNITSGQYDHMSPTGMVKIPATGTITTHAGH